MFKDGDGNKEATSPAEASAATLETAAEDRTEGDSQQFQRNFRKRRLSIPLIPQQLIAVAASSKDEADEEDGKLADDTGDADRTVASVSSAEEEKAHTFRKRRLSLTSNTSNSSSSHAAVPTQKRPRRASEVSATSAGSTSTLLRPKTLHAGEINPDDEPPARTTTAEATSSFWYGTTSSPERVADVAFPPVPKWHRRQTVPESGQDHKLPFSRDVVGTFSCHGVEPICDDDDDEEEGLPLQQPVLDNGMSNEKTTMVAKINQDRGGVTFPYGNNPRTALFAVYDGHGHGGELVSQFTLHEIQRRLEKHPTFHTDTERAFKETFIEVDNALKSEPIIEPMFAGTTACVALLANNRLSVANAGDSRAVLARRDSTDGEWLVMDLTEDQNPDLPAEMARIRGAGGYVSPSPGPGLSARVWLDAHFTQLGLAMARSIGDHAVSRVGVIAEPVVTFHDMEASDEFMILASDGVWEFLASEDAVRIVGDNLHLGATEACKILIEKAAARWHQEEGEYRDDITAIVVRLQELWKKPGQKTA